MMNFLLLFLVSCKSEQTSDSSNAVSPVEKLTQAPITDELRQHLPWLSTQKKPNPAKRRLQQKAFQYMIDNQDTSRPVLFDLYKEKRDAQKNIVVILGKMGVDEDVAFFDSALTSPVSGVSYAAAQALAESLSDTARVKLENRAKSNIGFIKKNAVIGIGFRGDKQSCGPLMSLVHSEDNDFRFQVVRALIRVGCLDDAAANLIQKNETDSKILKLFTQTGKAAVEPKKAVQK